MTLDLSFEEEFYASIDVFVLDVNKQGSEHASKHEKIREEEHEEGHEKVHEREKKTET